MKRYQFLAQQIEQRIVLGAFPVGSKLPSLRRMANDHSVSISTVQQAYARLEQKGLIESLPRAGFKVITRLEGNITTAAEKSDNEPMEVFQWPEVQNFLDGRNRQNNINFGVGSGNVRQSTLEPLFKAMRRLIGSHAMLNYNSVAGDEGLRTQIARISANSMTALTADNIITTNGCQQALSIALRISCRPGDIVAIGSPACYGMTQILQALQLKVLEIPSTAQGGMSAAALEMAFDKWPIKAIVLCPSIDNPRAHSLNETEKLAILQLAQTHKTTIIEDDIYGDLVFQQPRPTSIYSLDSSGSVILCSSFSKTVYSGMRVGYLVPGRRHYQSALHLKYAEMAASVNITELALAEFIQTGHYQKHLQQMRKLYRDNLLVLRQIILEHFPAGTKMSNPQGGFICWLQLPDNCNVAAARAQLAEQNIIFISGSLFSASGNFDQATRINYARLNEAAHQQALKLSGEILRQHCQQEKTTHAAADKQLAT